MIKQNKIKLRKTAGEREKNMNFLICRNRIWRILFSQVVIIKSGFQLSFTQGDFSRLIGFLQLASILRGVWYMRQGALTVFSLIAIWFRAMLRKWTTLFCQAFPLIPNKYVIPFPKSLLNLAVSKTIIKSIKKQVADGQNQPTHKKWALKSSGKNL